MSSRKDFFSRISAVRSVAATPYSADVLPTSDPHNVISRMIRASLVLSSFSFLETYLEDRVGEIMPIISRTRIPYGQMPARFRKLVTVKAFQGISTRIQFEKAAPLTLAEDNLKNLSKLFHKKPKYSPMGFSPVGSNISSTHVGDFVGDLGCPNGWAFLSNIAAIFSYNPISFKDEFDSFSEARNNAAHDVNYNVPSVTLEDYIKIAIRVGVAFDLIISFAAKNYFSSTTAAGLATSLSGAFADVAIIEPSGADWSVRVGGTTLGLFRTKKSSLSAAKSGAPFVVIRDAHLIPNYVWSKQ